MHICGVAAGHTPLPSQLAAGANVLAVQVAPRQPVAVDHGRQAPAPLHVPSFAQFPLAALVAIQRAFRSEPPAATAEQVPILPATLQLMHNPVVASLQAVLQQTPSVQKLLAHWVPVEQAAPAGFKPHELLTQVFGGTQSASSVQVFLHAPVAQMNVPHDWLAGVVHTPRPLHVDTGVADDVVAQTAALQLVPLVTNAHSPEVHRPVVPQVAVAVTAHRA